MKSCLLGAVCASVLALITTSTSAALLPLESRLGGLAYYDPNLNITWLADANLATTESFGIANIEQDAAYGTFGVRPDGTMTWYTANSWTEAMNNENYLGYNGWRLPTLAPVNSVSFDYTFSNNGTTDVGTAATGVGWGDSSELGYMFYVTLGNLGQCIPNGGGSSSDCFPQPGAGLKNTAPFINLQEGSVHWTGLEWAPNIADAWSFGFTSGNQNRSGSKNDPGQVWAVHDGDVVPIPPAVWLFASGVIGLIGMARRKATLPVC